MIELRMSQYTDAVRSYDQARHLDPSNAEANRQLAVAQAGAGLTSEAISTFEQGLKRFPKDALHLQEYGKVLLKVAATGKKEAETRAVQLLSLALTLESTLPEPHYHLGQLALQQGKTQEGLVHLKEAMKCDPKSSKVRFALSRAYRQLGLGDEAAEQLRIYQELKASEEEAPDSVPNATDNL
jgi:Flp pilus assembly protein TadD